MLEKLEKIQNDPEKLSRLFGYRACYDIMSFEPAQSYIMLSHVQSIEQLFILESYNGAKIIASHTGLDELNRFNTISLNDGFGMKIQLH